jgi:hypothetical protein
MGAQQGIWAKIANAPREWILGLWVIGMCIMTLNPIVAAPKLSEMVKACVVTTEYVAQVNTHADGRAHVIVEGPLGGGKGVYLQALSKSFNQLFFKYDMQVFVIPSSDSAAGFEDRIMKMIAADGIYSAEYGVDWVMFPYMSISSSFIERFCEDLRSLYTVDYFGTPFDDLPIMEGVDNFEDFDLHTVQTGGCTWGETNLRVWTKYNMYFITGCSSSCTPMLLVYQADYDGTPDLNIPYGHLDGVFGGYELDSYLDHPSLGAVVVAGEQFGTLYTVIIMIVGTVAYVLSRRREELE